MGKRIISFLLAVLMASTLLPTQVWAAELADSGNEAEDEIVLAEEEVIPPEESEPEEQEPQVDAAPVEQPVGELAESDVAVTSATTVASGYCGGEGNGRNLTWTLDSDGLLTISGKGAMANYDSESKPAPWCDNDQVNFQRVVIKTGVTSIGESAFYWCTNLTDVTIPDSVTTVGDYAFYSCSGLTNITIPNSVISIGSYTFSDCSSLTAITIPGSVTAIGSGTFYGCTNLISITIPNSVTSIGNRAFKDCTSLTSITIPSGVTSIGDNAFDACTSLTSITIPGSVTAIGKRAFSFCESLTSIDLPSSITTIENYTFLYCTGLTSITIPSSVTAIGNWAFSGCASLTDIYYTGSEAEWSAIQIGGNNDSLTTATIHYNYVVPGVDGAADSDAYIKEHSEFARSLGAFRNLNGFYRTVWYQEDGKRLWACYAWDVIGDIGELATLRFNDLTISADYYEMFLSDLILHMTESELTERWATKTAAAYNSSYQRAKNGVLTSSINVIKNTPELLKKAENEYGLTWKTTLEAEFYKQFDVKDYKLSGTPKILFETAFHKILKDDTVYKSIFEGLDNASAIISDFVNGGNLIYDFVNCYSLAEALSKTNQDMFEILYDVANELDQINPQYGEWFRKPLGEFYRAATNDTELLLALKDAYFKTANYVYDTFLKAAFKETVYQFVATEILHMSAAVGSASIKAVVAAYTATYAILDLALKNSSKGEKYKYMNYIAPFELALSNTAFSYGNQLLFTEKTYAQARKLDTAYKMLAYTNQFLYECAYTFDKLTGHKEELNLATTYKHRWENFKCHGSTYRLSGGKNVSMLCPVDVYLYDESNTLVMAVVNEEITVNTDPSITAIVYDGAKSFAYSNDRDYRVEIVARDKGTMDYLVAESDNGTELREIDFYDVPLKNAQKYSGEVPAALNLPSATYSLTSSDTTISCSYDSQSDKAAACNANQHTYGVWIEKKAATEQDDGLKERYCSNCGKRECQVIPIIIRGDVNRDSTVDVYDLQMLYECCCESRQLSGDTFQCADVNQDSKITVLDVQMLYTYLTIGNWK